MQISVRHIFKMDLAKEDRLLIWHPFTQEKIAEPPVVITRGKGSYLYDENDRKKLDMVSSWWVNLHGHSHPDIAEAIYEQSITMEHIIFAGFTHKPAITLCKSLRRFLPSSLRKFFFTDNGSTATEVALKMAYQFWKNQGLTKPLFLAFEGGYHGDTMGSMSVGAKSGYHNAYEELFFPALWIPFPDTWIGDDKVDEKEKNSIRILEQHLISNADKISAFILEPLVQGASGMRMCRPAFVQKIVNTVRKHNVLVIFDEVMTGFGRTGTLFAFQQTEIVPDILCLSKGITGGFLPLAVTVTSQEIYNMFLADDNESALLHGHSYTANPLGCAAAIASLKLLTNTDTTSAINKINSVHNEQLTKLLKECKNIKNGRIRGTIAAFNVMQNVDVKILKKWCYEKGVIIRPLGSVIYFLPPYCITSDELSNAYAILSQGLRIFE